MIERSIVLGYLLVCVVVGAVATRRVFRSADEYWVAGRKVGAGVNALAIMASLASGGSVVGVVGIAYRDGIPATLAIFAGAVVGFPLATILVAGPLRRLARFTITDFLVFRYPHGLVRGLVPAMHRGVAHRVHGGANEGGGDHCRSASGSGVRDRDHHRHRRVRPLCLLRRHGGGHDHRCAAGGAPVRAHGRDRGGARDFGGLTPRPALGSDRRTPAFGQLPVGGTGHIGFFVIWATAIPVIPHIVMRVATARNPRSARLSLNLATIGYGVMILTVILLIAPVGVLEFPGLTDPDEVFLRIVGGHFPPLLRGLAVAAVLAAVMSTTDAFLLAVSSAVAHDLLGGVLSRKSRRAQAAVRVGATWAVGAVALYWAYSPPELLTRFYTAGVGLLSAGLFIPVTFGIWWKRANLAGGVAALVCGAFAYSFLLFAGPALGIGVEPIVAALPVSLAAMLVGGFFGRQDPGDRARAVERLHRPD